MSQLGQGDGNTWSPLIPARKAGPIGGTVSGPMDKNSGTSVPPTSEDAQTMGQTLSMPRPAGTPPAPNPVQLPPEPSGPSKPRSALAAARGSSLPAGHLCPPWGHPCGAFMGRSHGRVGWSAPCPWGLSQRSHRLCCFCRARDFGVSPPAGMWLDKPHLSQVTSPGR